VNLSQNPPPDFDYEDEMVFLQDMRRKMDSFRENEKKILEIPPFYPDKHIRHKHIQQYAMARARINESLRTKHRKTSFATAMKHSSKIDDLSKLKLIFLSSMMLNKVHYGKYLICRVIEKPFQTDSSSLLVEDENDDIEGVAIHNYEINQSCQDLFPKGTALYIKEPFLKISMNGNERFIRIDSPSDILIDDYQYSGKFRPQLNQLKFSKDPEVIKEKGNDYYKNDKYELALRCYKIALNLNHKQPEILHLNCSAAYLGLELYSQAYLEAKIALALSENNKKQLEKTLFRIGMSAYQMRQWEIALENFTKCLKENPENTEAFSLLQQTKLRIKEQTTGKYNFFKLYKQSLNENNFDLDVADYHNEELLLLQECLSKGRHIIAKNDIPRGTLLIVSKAVSLGRWDEKNPIYTFNLVDNTIGRPSLANALSILFKKIQGNPYIAKEVYSLHSSNLFNRNEPVPDHIVDISRLECITSFNGFHGEISFKKKNSEIENLKKPVGIWIYPSLLNHSCLPNATRSYIGDLMIIFSSRNIKKDEEITLSYVDTLDSYDERKQAIAKYSFDCLCELCEFEKNDPKRKERETILKNSEEIMQNIYDKEKILNFKQSLEKTYDKNAKYKFGLLDPLDLWQRYLLTKEKFEESAESTMVSYTMLREVIPDEAIMAANRIKQCYDWAKNKKESEKWWKIVLEDDFFKNEKFLKLSLDMQKETLIIYR